MQKIATGILRILGIQSIGRNLSIILNIRLMIL